MKNFNRWLASLGLCTLTGIIVGLITGFIFGLAQLAVPLRLPASDVLRVGAMLGLSGWLVVLLFIGAIAAYGVRAIAVPALVTSILTALATVFVDNAIGLPLLSALAGLVIGALTGRALCAVCAENQQSEKRDG